MLIAKFARTIAPVAKTAITNGRKLTTEVAKNAVEDEFKTRIGISHVQTGPSSAGAAVASLLRAQVGLNTKASGAALPGNSAVKVWGARLDESITTQSNISTNSRFPGDINLPAGNLLLRPRRIPL